MTLHQDQSAAPRAPSSSHPYFLAWACGTTTACLLLTPFWGDTPAAGLVPFVAFSPLAWAVLRLRSPLAALSGGCAAAVFHGYALWAFWPATRMMAVVGPLFQALLWSLVAALGSWAAAR